MTQGEGVMLGHKIKMELPGLCLRKNQNCLNNFRKLYDNCLKGLFEKHGTERALREL